MESTSTLTFSDYPFLKELGLEEENDGCYRDGTWSSTSDKVQVSVNPHNNQPIARIKLASLEDYNANIEQMEKEKVRWMKTPGPVRGEIVR